jgi:hypothetical protein
MPPSTPMSPMKMSCQNAVRSFLYCTKRLEDVKASPAWPYTPSTQIHAQATINHVSLTDRLLQHAVTSTFNQWMGPRHSSPQPIKAVAERLVAHTRPSGGRGIPKQREAKRRREGCEWDD